MVMTRELAVALTQVIDALTEASMPSLYVTEAEIDFPLEVAAVAHRGKVVFFGSAPHSRWMSGFLPDVHLAKLRVGLLDGEDAGEDACAPVPGSEARCGC
jgi:hypothetical protein